jgi:methionyl-tRNA synthetase
MNVQRRKILVTAALPYANGPIHLGHLVEYIQTDIWVRFQKLRGHRAIFMWADDTHGTAIMIRARAEGRSEEEVIAEAAESHKRDFSGFRIGYDNYGSTHSNSNRKLCATIWESIRAQGLVKEKDIEQLFDVEQGTFLADRFVRGTCPQCKSTDQPGDNCSRCGTTYTPAELIGPISTLSGTKPETRSAKHLFIELEQLHDFLFDWTQHGDHLQPEVANYLKGHFLGDPNSNEGKKELRDWDISRPAPYFGFEIPDSPGNYWYVWFDAPIGYIASTEDWCAANGEKLDDWWKSQDTEIHHFIGKDITYFHTLFWPGMLKSAGFSLPTKVHIHGFLTVNGEKMAKSKGTAFKAETYLKHLDPEALRYFYAAKLGPRLDDIDLNLQEFATKVNADLVGKVINLASRSAKFVAKTGLSVSYPDDGGLFEKAAAAGDEIAEAYEHCDFNKAMRLILELADQANPFVENAAPWKLKKDPEKASELQDVCTVALNLFRQLIIYLAPVLPGIAEKAGALLNDPIVSWDQSRQPLTGTPVAKFKHMMKRIEDKEIQAMVEESKTEAEKEIAAAVADSSQDAAQPLIDEPLAEECTIDDFVKVDLRVARVLKAEHVEGARKLLKLTLGLGGDETRQVFAGIKAAYEPEKLVGRLVVMVANLKPRQMKFGLSEGMVCASGSGGEDVFLLSPDEGAKPGQRVH